MWKLPKHKLPEHGGKVSERILEKRLRKVVKLDEMPMEFMLEEAQLMQCLQ